MTKMDIPFLANEFIKILATKYRDEISIKFISLNCSVHCKPRLKQF